MIKTASLRGKFILKNNAISTLAYADDLLLFGETEEDLQNSVNDLNGACMNFGMTISSSKTQVMHIGKVRKSFQCKQNECVLEQVSEFKYLGYIFSEDGKYNSTEERIEIK